VLCVYVFVCVCLCVYVCVCECKCMSMLVREIEKEDLKMYFIIAFCLSRLKFQAQKSESMPLTSLKWSLGTLREKINARSEKVYWELCYDGKHLA
jgi:hypothetical protein